MQSSRNIIKRFAIGRCPPPALGKMSLPVDTSPENGRLFAHARLANCCRKLYTRLFGRSREALVGQALESRRRKYNMSWLMTALRLNATEDNCAVSDRLSMPLKDCLELEPQSICAASAPELCRQFCSQPSDKCSRTPSYYKNVRVQSLVIKAKVI